MSLLPLEVDITNLPLSLHISDITNKWDQKCVWTFVKGIFHLAPCFQGLTISQHMSVINFSLLLILFHCIHVLFILASVRRYLGGSSFGALCSTFMHKFLCEHTFSFLFSSYITVEMLGIMVNPSYLTLGKLLKSFPNGRHHCPLSAIVKDSFGWLYCSF